MLIIRKYRRLQWFDFLEKIESELTVLPQENVYFELLDEIRMRKVESVSEGACFKMKAPAMELLEKFETRLEENSQFSSPDNLIEFKSLVDSI